MVEFDAPTTYDDLDNDRPRSSEGDRGDLSPVGIGSDGVALTVTHLRVLRDIYYIADRSLDRVPITDFRARTSMVPLYRPEELVEFLSTPGAWDRGHGTSAFDDRQEVDFELDADQFFVLGDNSPASSDARFWPGEHYVDRSLLVGKALFVYWPHPLNLHDAGHQHLDSHDSQSSRHGADPLTCKSRPRTDCAARSRRTPRWRCSKPTDW